MKLPLCSLFSLYMLSLAADAASLTFTPSQDASLFQDTNGTLAGGASAGIYTGRVSTNDATPLRRGLFQFDITSIPAGSTITAVSLQLVVTSSATTTAALTTLHRVTDSWNEGTATTSGGGGGPRSGDDATWTHRDGIADWAAEGGDFIGAPSASQTITGTGAYVWSNAGMVTDVQFWLDNATANNGWLTMGNEDAARSVKVFGSREAAAASVPTLTVTYTAPIPEPSVHATALLALLGLVSMRKRR